MRPPWARRRIAAAIGERMEFHVQANSTLLGARDVVPESATAI